MLTNSSASRTWRRGTRKVILSGGWWLVRYALPPFFALLFLAPLIWLVANSLRKAGDFPPPGINLIPNPVVWANYLTVVNRFQSGIYIFNSILVLLMAVPVTLIVASAAGYAMAQLSVRARKRLVIMTITLFIIPLPALWLPRFIMFSAINLDDSLFALAAPAIMGTSPFFVLLFYWTFRRIPPDLFDAARIDGANILQNWRFVALPLARPTIAVVVVLTFVLYWGDYLAPLMYMRTIELYPYAYRLQELMAQDITIQPLAMAGVVIAIAPVVLLFLLVQRYFWPEGRLEAFARR